MSFNSLIPEVSKVMKVTNHNVSRLHLDRSSGQGACYLAQVTGSLQLEPVTAGAGSFTTVNTAEKLIRPITIPSLCYFLKFRNVWDLINTLPNWDTI